MIFIIMSQRFIIQIEKLDVALCVEEMELLVMDSIIILVILGLHQQLHQSNVEVVMVKDM